MAQNKRALSVIAALDWLEDEYENIPEEIPIELQQEGMFGEEEEPAEEGQENDQEEEAEETERNEEQQEEEVAVEQ